MLSITEFLDRAVSHRSASTVLQPLCWYLGVVGGILVSMITVGAPQWLLVATFCMLALGGVVFLAAFVYFGLTNPEYLRTERFALSKMAMEKNLLGDSLTGLREYIDDGSPQERLDAADELSRLTLNPDGGDRDG